MGYLFSISANKWKSQQRRMCTGELDPSQATVIFLKWSYAAAKFWQFSIHRGQQIKAVAGEGNKHPYAKRKTVWMIICLLWLRGREEDPN